ncbi:MAG: Crp/Fnr family transcriptional regulator [Comamonadaceae bacterium]|nr:Crp/Fnr family transcriptional regulator [Comamonadaceae bacterium]
MMSNREVTATLLRGLPMFVDTPQEALEAVARVCMLRRVPRNAHVVRAGEPIDFVYLVLAGRLERSGRATRKGARRSSRCWARAKLFGEMGALDEEARSATVMAVTPSTLVAIGKTDFKRCLQANFDVTRYVMRNLVQRLRMADRRIESLALLDVAGRVVRLLRDLAQTTNGEQVVSARFRRQDIAKMVGASREMVSRVVKDLELRGLIEVSDGRIVLRAAR